MIKKSVIFAFLLSLLMGFISFIGPQYISFITGKEVRDFQPVKTTMTELCDSVAGICTKNYKTESLQRLFGNNVEVLVLGRVWNASVISCGLNVMAQYGVPQNPVGSRDTNNQFLLIDQSKISACESELNIKVFYPIGQKKSGLLDGQPYFSTRKVANAIKRFNEFILQDLKIFNLCGLLAVLLFSIFIRIVTIDKGSKERVFLASILAIGAVAQSGVLEVWLPLDSMPLLNRWAATLAYSIYLSFSTKYLSEKNSVNRYAVFLGLILFLGLLLATQNRIVTWVYFSFSISVIFITLACIQKNLKMLCLGILTTLSSFEFQGASWAPNGYTAPTFLALLILSENHKAFVSYLKINRLLKLSRTKGEESQERKHHPFRTHAIIKLFQKQFKIGRITILNLTDPEAIQLQKYVKTSAQPESISIKELTPVFAHVVTTGNSLINVHSESKLVESLRRGGGRQLAAASDHFTVLPIFVGKETIGAISLTDYDTEQFKSSLNYSTFLFCLDILKGLLVEHLLTAPKTESLNKISKLNQQINLYDVSSCNSLEDLINTFGEVLNRTFGWRIISATLPTQDNLLKVGRVYSFDPEIENQVLKGKIYAHEDNRQGPLALAVHEKKPVIVPNTKWLDGVVHPNTMKFFNIHSTRTAAFIPVLGPDRVAVGVYWIEGIQANEISYSDRELFNSFMNTLSERIKLMKSDSKLQISQNSLAQFLPKHLVEDYLAGKEVSEKDHGFLMMFDLKGSTSLSHALENSTFRNEVEKFKDMVNSAMNPYGWALQEFMWDGFEFTYTSYEEKINVVQWKDLLEPIFVNWKNELIQKYGNKAEINALSYRMCFTYGNISRGVIMEGATQKWGFTGDAIALVSKVEQAAKHLPGKVFCDPSMLKRSHDEWNELHTTNQGLVVYGLDEASNREKKIAA